MAVDLHKLTYDEYTIIEGLINNPSEQQEKGILEYYCGDTNYRLINRVDRYLLGQGIGNVEERVERIAEVLDKYNMFYTDNHIRNQIKDKGYVPLRQTEDRIKYYKSEIDLTMSLAEHSRGLQQLAFAILTYTKYNINKYGNAKILNNIDTITSLYRVSGAGSTSNEKVFFLVHELVKRDLIVVPISLKSFDDMIEVNFVEEDENAEVVYELTNTDAFKLGEVFDSLFGEYKSKKPILEISLIDDYYCVHPTIAETVEVHNKRHKKKVDKTSVTRCATLERTSAGDSAFIEWNWEDKDDEEYIEQVITFVRKVMKPRANKVKKQGGKWIISREFMGAIHEETGLQLA